MGPDDLELTAEAAGYEVTKSKGTKTLDAWLVMPFDGELSTVIGLIIFGHEPVTPGASTDNLEFRVRLLDTDQGKHTGAWITVFGSEGRSPLYDYLIKPT